MLDYKWLVQDDRIHASLYTDPQIFADELERVFHRGWVFVGHDSEVARPGDFVTRHLGTEPVVMARGKDGAIAVLVNRSAHRGTMVCGAERGNTRTFTCPYHGWTYDLGGELLGAPYPGGYAGVRQEPARAHVRAPRLELPRLRLRQPLAHRHLAGRASGLRHPADRPLLRSIARGGGRAAGGLGEAPLRRQLENAA